MGSVMVLAAVKELKDKKGASLPAIKKYVAANYKIDIAKSGLHIRKAIKKLVEAEKLAQTKGRFRAVKEDKPKKAKKPAKKTAKKAKKPAAKKSPKKAAKKPAAKKAKSPKKAAAKKPAAKKPAAKKPAAKKPAAKKSPKKAA